MRKKGFKRTAAFLMALSLVATVLVGCQSISSNQAETERMGNTGTPSGNQVSAGENSRTALGRFLEEEMELPEKFGNIYKMKKLKNGSIRMVTDSGEGKICVWDSRDGGDTWEKQEQFSDSFPESSMPAAVAISPEGAVWISNMKVSEDGEASWEHFLVKEDGAVSAIDLTDSLNSENGSDYISNIEFLDHDTVILQDFTHVYQYNSTSPSEVRKFPDLGTTIYGMMAVDEKVILLTENQVYVYDGKTMEEQEISDGAKENML